MNFLDAINVHIAWKLRLQEYISGTSHEDLNANAIGKDDQCELGHWLYHKGKKYRNLPLYKQVKDKHALFHTYAAEIVRMTDANKSVEAQDLLSNVYAPVSNDIKALIVQLSRQVHSQ